MTPDKVTLYLDTRDLPALCRLLARAQDDMDALCKVAPTSIFAQTYEDDRRTCKQLLEMFEAMTQPKNPCDDCGEEAEEYQPRCKPCGKAQWREHV